jgi:hypothetical protein
MLSLEVRQFAEKLNQLSLEDKQWLLQQLTEQINAFNENNVIKNADLFEITKTFNITPAPSGSGFNDTTINHDKIFVNSILSES